MFKDSMPSGGRTPPAAPCLNIGRGQRCLSRNGPRRRHAAIGMLMYSRRRMSRVILVLLAALMFQRVATAADDPPPPMPAAQETPPPRSEPKPLPVVVPADAVEEQAAPVRPPDLSYGVATQLRWITIPAFVLNLFTKQNVPLSSWGTGFQFFRRRGNFDFAISLTYVNLSPADGNWLGKGRDPANDTDFVQFRSLAMYGADASFIWHSNFTDWFGIHYGAGIGIGIITGDILRTSNDNTLCTEANAGNLAQCHPKAVSCTGSSCSEQDLRNLGAGPDSPAEPHRFIENSVPAAVPIVNMVAGVDFRLPQVRGWEAKLEGGFYNALFLGGAVGYSF
jgi:hypothetical protein